MGSGRKFGYSRVSTSDQDWSLQLDALIRAGVDDRDIYREKASGAKRDRTELRRMLDQLRPGDQATVYRLDRLARSQLHLLQIVEEIEAKGAKLVSVMDHIDTSTATGKMVVGVLAVLAEFERNLLLERSEAGRAIARQRKVRFGRPPKITSAMIRQVMLAHDDPNTTVPETCRVLGISKSSYYAALRAGQREAIAPAEAA
ncbi:recombinase family protein [Microvirga sp. 3-52]|uniref:recombinase family protein n=1 Tax=Microvirga sp. 3-52 TaxID=2792425 RepID=UPI001ACEC1FE|nr:recombinase family protein [Microvirga sp. 3-52]MBO1904236.1 recombinase family protein [Microvirga sp. 3-52]MBS7451588.1 recombinase family protein [Microvirga sp. 3-52]